MNYSYALILTSIKPLLELTRFPQHSNFTASQSEIDCIIALSWLSEIQKELNHLLLFTTYLDIKATFDFVKCHALWKILCSKGSPQILMDLIIGLHNRIGATIQINGKLSRASASCKKSDMASRELLQLYIHFGREYLGCWLTNGS